MNFDNNNYILKKFKMKCVVNDENFSYHDIFDRDLKNIRINIESIIHDTNYKKYNDTMYTLIYNFFIKNCLNESENNCVVSLSGGVDSMVLISILILIKNINKFEKKHKLDFNIYAIHINYGNRLETDQEEQFLTEWCHENNVEIIVKKMNDYKRCNQDRSEYEEETKELDLNYIIKLFKNMVQMVYFLPIIKMMNKKILFLIL